nr:hypothetical protein [uncultured Blautia sp.]
MEDFWEATASPSGERMIVSTSAFAASKSSLRRVTSIGVRHTSFSVHSGWMYRLCFAALSGTSDSGCKMRYRW